jgi:hypothetical protein
MHVRAAAAIAASAIFNTQWSIDAATANYAASHTVCPCASCLCDQESLRSAWLTAASCLCRLAIHAAVTVT